MSAAWEPALPYELVEATEHHGPYVCTSYGSTVCDFYAMSDPSSPSVRNGGTSKPISFTDAAEHAEFMVRAANAYGPMLESLRAIVDRAENGELGTSKVQDMKRLAVAILAQQGGAA